MIKYFKTVSNKASQIKFGETFAILIVVFFAFIFGAQFYVSSLEESFEDSQSQREDNQALERLNLVLNYGPFLHSSNNNVEKMFNLLSIKSFSNLDERVKNKVFGSSEIVISLYNTTFDETSQNIMFEKDQDLVLFNNTEQFYSSSGELTQTNKILPHSSVITVYDPKERTTQVGVITVRSFY